MEHVAGRLCRRFLKMAKSFPNKAGSCWVSRRVEIRTSQSVHLTAEKSIETFATLILL